MGRAPQGLPERPTLAFNELTGAIVRGTSKGLDPHPTIPGQFVLNLQKGWKLLEQ
jgi:hypothetical protein